MYDKVKVKTWVDALRSGDYKQGQGQLCQSCDDGSVSYCCLGVYKKVVDNSTDKYLKSNKGNVGAKSAYNTLNDMFGPVFVTDLIGKNDSEGYAFKDIADYIEKELL